MTHFYDSATATKLVHEKADTFIDCFTNKDRRYGNASKVGFGPNMSADAYMLGDIVILYAWVVYKNNPMQGRLVSFEVYSPLGLFLGEQNMTDEDGVAWIKFRIPTASKNYTQFIGKWYCFQKVLLGDEYYNDTLDFAIIVPPVGGIIVPIDSVSINKLELLMPYIGVISVIIFPMVATIVFVKRKKK